MLKKLSSAFMALLSAFSCVEDITPALPSAPPLLVVEALVNTLPTEQRIKLSITQPYFENAPIPAATGATVRIIEETEDQLLTRDFIESPDQEGMYIWRPATAGETLGTEGSRYTLQIDWDGEQYEATSYAKRVPPIDSVVAVSDTTAEFFASDIEGRGDIYQVKAIIETDSDGATKVETASSGVFQGLVYDASFLDGSSDPELDGVEFFPSVREVTIEDEKLLEPPPNKRYFIELHALTPEATIFFRGVENQQRREIGDDNSSVFFVSLFASAPYNVYSNIRNTKEGGKAAVGCFSMANASRKEIPRKTAVSTP